MDKKFFFIVHWEEEYIILEVENLNDEKIYLKIEEIAEKSINICKAD